jgi:hypothetical protein
LLNCQENERGGRKRGFWRRKGFEHQKVTKCVDASRQKLKDRLEQTVACIINKLGFLNDDSSHQNYAPSCGITYNHHSGNSRVVINAPRELSWRMKEVGE